MTKLIKVPAHVLKALLITAATLDVRFYLTGINVDIREGICTLVTTDGHRLARVIVECEGFAADEVVSDILPREVIEMVLSNKSYLRSLTSRKEITLFKDGKHWFMGNGEFEMGISCIDGRFPDWRRVIPKNFDVAPEEEQQFQLAYLIDLQKIAKLLGDPIPSLKLNGANRPATMSFPNSNYDVVLMPMRI